jgi:hypothetical protein
LAFLLSNLPCLVDNEDKSKDKENSMLDKALI